MTDNDRKAIGPEGVALAEAPGHHTPDELSAWLAAVDDEQASARSPQMGLAHERYAAKGVGMATKNKTRAARSWTLACSAVDEQTVRVRTARAEEANLAAEAARARARLDGSAHARVRVDVIENMAARAASRAAEAAQRLEAAVVARSVAALAWVTACELWEEAKP